MWILNACNDAMSRCVHFLIFPHLTCVENRDVGNEPKPESKPDAEDEKDDGSDNSKDGSKDSKDSASKSKSKSKSKKQKFSKKDLKGDDLVKGYSNGEYTVIACLVNAGKTAILTDYDRGKKLKKGIDSNKIERIIGDYNHKLFGAPEGHYYADPEDEDAEREHDDGYTDGYYKGNIYDCYVIKDHFRILPRYILTFKRHKQCFIWMGERFEDVKQAATKLIKAREDIQRMMPNLIYAGDRYEKVLKLNIKLLPMLSKSGKMWLIIRWYPIFQKGFRSVQSAQKMC